MIFKKLFWVAGILILLTGVGFVRSGAFWSTHTDPVELGYVTLAMKMGTHFALTGYHPAGPEIRRRLLPEVGGEGRMIPVATPVEVGADARPSFDTWPSETNPFKFKPPMFPAFLAFSHHKILGARTSVYPLLVGAPQPDHNDPRPKVVFDVQSWAVLVPYLSGLAVILLVFILGWGMFGPGAGLLAAMLTAVHPYQAHASERVWPEALLTIFLLLTALILRFFLKRRSWAGCFGAGIAFALAFLTDQSALFALPAFWFWTAANDPQGKSQSAGIKVFNPFMMALVVGALLVSQSWIGYVPRIFGEPILSRTVFEVLGPAQALLGWTSTGLGFVIFCPPLLAALRPKGEAVFLMLIVLSMVSLRWVYFYQAPWDERAWVPAVPFTALAAASALSTLPARVYSMVKAS